MNTRMNMTALANARVGRFSIIPEPGHYIKSTNRAEYDGNAYVYGKLDDIMSEIPGKDNYLGDLEGKNFGFAKYKADMQRDVPLNTARYHRQYKVKKFGDDGQAIQEEGFSDHNLWIAETSSARIASMGVPNCLHDNGKEVCTRAEGRFTFAIPLEVIWLTPLSTWNPYNVTVFDWANRRKIFAGGRTGELTPEKAFHGVAPDNYYLTPTEFFHGREVGRNPADTTRKSVGVLDPHGQVRTLSASGVRFFLPDIDGVGRIRTRYPVMPVHQEGSAIWKNLQALQDITMNMNLHANMFMAKPEIHAVKPNMTGSTHYITTDSMRPPPAKHHHDVYISVGDMKMLRDNATIRVFTMENMGHKHELELRLDTTYSTALYAVTCDGHHRCFDRHGMRIWQV